MKILPIIIRPREGDLEREHIVCACSISLLY